MRGFALAAVALSVLVACGDDDGTTTGTGTGTGGASSTSSSGTGGMAEPTLTETAAEWLSGRFDSSAQAAENPAFLGIQLVTCEVPALMLGDTVLYVEQAASTTPTAPYRQRIYVITTGPDPETQVVSEVYELTNPSTYVGRCNGDSSTPVLTTEVVEREGCAVTLTWMGEHFEGATQGMDCSSTLMGASYATSEVSLYANRIESWDRGFDDMDTQVWGATAGPYIFQRQP